MAVIGIDLGTTYSAAARHRDGETEIVLVDGNPTLPSVVGVLPSGKIAIGNTAKRNQARNPQDTVVEIKRQMGKKVEVPLGQKSYTPPEISALILQKIKAEAAEYLGEEIRAAVISCPAYFKNPQREAIKEAASIAGLKLLRIVNEPTAAAYAYGLSKADRDGKNLFLVYDLGGGTFDVTVVEMAAGDLEVIGTGGDPELGGGNFDDRIVDWMIERLKERTGYIASLDEAQLRALRMTLKVNAEEAKKALCGPPPRPEYQFQLTSVGRFEGKPVVFDEILTMEAFEKMIDDLLQNSMQWIDEAFKVPKEKRKYREADVTEILLVGGSTRVPAVVECLRKRFPKTPIHGVESGINPDEVVAMGAGIIAAEADPKSLEDVEHSLVDVTGHTLSVAAIDPQAGREKLQRLIPKETQIPTRASHTFSSAGHMQRQCKIRVYQGEGEEIDLERVTMIGEFLIDIQPISEETPLEVGLVIDENGLLTASAKDLLTGRQVHCQINYNDSAQLSPEELKRKRAELEASLVERVGATVNPLAERPAAAMPGHVAPPATAATSPARAPFTPVPAVAAPADARTMMNPIMRALYDQAIHSFGQVPQERQTPLLTMVTEIEQAAMAGDQARLMSYYNPLTQLLEGAP